MKINLHICPDDNFIAKSMQTFETFYPDTNYYIMFKKAEPRKYPDNLPIYHIDWKPESSANALAEILRNHKIERVIVHGLLFAYIPLFQRIKEVAPKAPFYWIFWGYELYSALAERGKYHLLDSYSPFSMLTYITPSRMNGILRRIGGRHSRAKILEQSLPYIDYFCFWLPYDYQLLLQHYPSDIKYKHFQYGAVYRKDVADQGEIMLPEKWRHSIMINHQATMNGNFQTIFNKLKSLKGITEYDIHVPLSYGSAYVRKDILKRGQKQFGDRFKPILNLMPFNEYRELLSSIPVAIFGQRRQEASGNIIALLRTGAKVFLREDNALLQFYKDKGYKVFSFENDLQTIDDLQPLSSEDQLHNIEIANNSQVCYEDFMPTLFD